MLLELAAAPRFEMVGFGDAEGCLPGGLAATEPCMHATMGPKLAPALQLAVCGCARRHGAEASMARIVLEGRYTGSCSHRSQ